MARDNIIMILVGMRVYRILVAYSQVWNNSNLSGSDRPDYKVACVQEVVGSTCCAVWRLLRIL